MHLEIVAHVVVLLVAGLLLYVTWFDFHNLKITNRSVLALLGLYVVWAAATGFTTLLPDLGAGVLLFVISFAMWLARAMGAGDVKLYFGIGLFVGMEHLPFYAAALLASSVLFLLSLIVAGRSKARSGIVGRLKEIRLSGKAPYAIPICAAAVPLILFRSFA